MAKSWHNDFQDQLTEEESLDNAQLVANRLYPNGWTKSAISAVVGNMRHESYVNPHMYELACSTFEEDCGYGLVQWTPRSKFVDWAKDRGYTDDDIKGDAQLDRLEYEAENEIQYSPNSLSETYGEESKFDFSFKDFRRNKPNLKIKTLTEAFMWNYERPDYQAGLNTLEDRQAFAQKVYDNIDWEEAGEEKDESSSSDSDSDSDSNIKSLTKSFSASSDDAKIKKRENGKPQWYTDGTDSYRNWWGDDEETEYFYSIDGNTIYIQYGQNKPDWASAIFIIEEVDYNETKNEDRSIDVEGEITIKKLDSVTTQYAGDGVRSKTTFTLNGEVIKESEGYSNKSSQLSEPKSVKFSETIEPGDKSKSTKLKMENTYPDGEYNDVTVTMGMSLENENKSQYIPMAIRINGNWRSLDQRGG